MVLVFSDIAKRCDSELFSSSKQPEFFFGKTTRESKTLFKSFKFLSDDDFNPWNILWILPILVVPKDFQFDVFTRNIGRGNGCNETTFVLHLGSPLSGEAAHYARIS